MSTHSATKPKSGNTVKQLRKILSPLFGVGVVGNHITKSEVTRARNLQEDAAEANDIVLTFAETNARKLGLDPKEAVVEGPPKELPRIFEKAIGKHNGRLEEVPDIRRLRILVEKPEDVRNFRRRYLGDNPVYEGRYGVLQNGHPTNEISIKEFEDFYLIPSKTGRVAIHMKLDIRLSGAHSVPYEIQVIHKDMVDTEIFTHDNYQKAEAIKRTANSQGRPLTIDENLAVEGYHASNKERYVADSYNYDLIGLRRLDLQRVDHTMSLAI